MQRIVSKFHFQDAQEYHTPWITIATQLSLQTRQCRSSNFILFQDSLAFLGALHFHISLSTFTKTPAGILICSTLTLLVNLVRIYILILSLLIHKVGPFIWIPFSQQVFHFSVYRSCTSFIKFIHKNCIFYNIVNTF